MISRCNWFECIYFWLITEKPKLIASVDVNATIGPNGLLIPATFKDFTSVYWYKDGAIIPSNSQLLTIYANISLGVAYQGPALNGFYQIFYQNNAGFGAVTQFVTMSGGTFAFTLQFAN